MKPGNLQGHSCLREGAKPVAGCFMSCMIRVKGAFEIMPFTHVVNT